MLHDLSAPGWRQTCFLPASGGDLEACDLAVDTLGRLHARGRFDLHQIGTQVSLHFTEAGTGTITIDGCGWRVGPGSVYCFRPGQRIHRRARGGERWRYSWVRLVGRRVETALELLGIGPGSWLRDDLPLARCRGLLDEIESAYRSGDHSPCFPQAAAWRLIDLLCLRREGSDASAAASLRRILDEGFRSPLRIGAIATQFGVDRSTLYRRFTAAYGRSPKRYLDDLRLEHARALLTGGRLSVAAVAARCGYTSADRFAQAYRQRFGHPPSRAG